MYEIFDQLLASKTWHLMNPADEKLFYETLDKVIWSDPFSPDHMRAYMRKKSNLKEGDGASAIAKAIDNYATDVAIIDVIWNGLNESLKIAAMADVYEINVAPHNFYGHLCSAISATFSAVAPNFRVMETDIDSAPWRDEFYTVIPTIENGEFVLPKGPGWGIDVNEKAVRARPPKH